MAIIVPHTPAAGKPWVFRGNNLNREALVDQALLAKGYHIVIAPITAQAGPLKEQWDAIYKVMTENGFSTTPVMEGTGAGAGEAYAWAIENPSKSMVHRCREPRDQKPDGQIGPDRASRWVGKGTHCPAPRMRRIRPLARIPNPNRRKTLQGSRRRNYNCPPSRRWSLSIQSA